MGPLLNPYFAGFQAHYTEIGPIRKKVDSPNRKRNDSMFLIPLLRKVFLFKAPIPGKPRLIPENHGIITLKFCCDFF